MCLILFAVDGHEEYDLVIAANRDEFYSRPTLKAHIWSDPSWMVAGKDLEGGGTWLGMDLRGRIAMLTNYRDPERIKENAPSRGELVCNFFSSGDTTINYLKHIAQRGNVYNGFNLICADRSEVRYFSNYGSGQKVVGPGIHGLSNALLNDPWPKVIKGREKFSALLNESEITVQDLFRILYDDAQASDEDLPDTGIGSEWERQLSPLFIKTDQYGSRTSTVILRRRDGHVTFAERSYNVGTFDYTDREFHFRIKH